MPDTGKRARADSVSSLSNVNKLWESNDSTAEFVRQNSLKSNDDSFKTSDSFIARLMNTSDSLFKSSSDLFKSAVSNVASRVPEFLNSRDWSSSYLPNHVEVDVNKVFNTSDRPESHVEDSTKTNWEALYESELEAKPAAPQSLPVSVVSAPMALNSVEAKETFSENSSNALPLAQSQKIKWVDKITDKDVLLGRGGRANNHAGNKRYLAEKDRIQPRYLNATKQEKKDISQELVDIVHAWGGRFLKEDEAMKRWYEVDEKSARKKASQSLREINTPEQRARKRARYSK